MTNKEASDAQEKMIAKFLGWKQVTGSGSRPNFPGDIVGEEWMGECKTHTSPNHRIIFKKSVWDKICEEANSRFKFPAYFTDDGSQKSYNTWVLFKKMELPCHPPYTPSNPPYTIVHLCGNIKDSYSFMNRPKQVSPLVVLDHIVFTFDFNTISSGSSSQCRLYMTKLDTFRDIINLE